MLQGPIPTGKAQKLPIAPRDLVDFHLRWAEFRPLMLRLQARGALSPDEASTLAWLIALSDRVGAQDIG